MRKLHYILFLVLGMACANSIYAQDIHFSHIHASPTYLNPGMNGVIGDGDLRFIVNAKEQWNSVTNAYKTFNFSSDMKLAQFGAGTTLGAGINMFIDRAGDLDYTTSNVSAALSVIKALDRDSRNLISLGFQGGWIKSTFDYTKMIGFEQEDVTEGMISPRLNNWDLSVGGAWYYSYDYGSFFYIGASASHLNKSNVSFFNRVGHNNEAPIPMFRKFILHGGGHIELSKQVSILPSAIFMDQGPHREINTGSFIKFNKNRSYYEADYAIYLGAWMRWYFEKDINGIDSFQASVRMDINRTYFTFSYDFNVSTLSRASRGLGSAELSIIQVFDSGINRNSRVVCPNF